MTIYTLDIYTYAQQDTNNSGYATVFFQGVSSGFQDFTLGSSELTYGSYTSSYTDQENMLYTSIENMIEVNYAFKSGEVLAYFNSSIFSGDSFVLGTRYNYDASIAYTYEKLLNLIPTNTNQLTNGASFITSSGAPVQSVNGLSGAVSLSIPSIARTTTSLSLSLVGTGATGTQISATKPSTVKVNVSLSATASIAGAATSNITLKKCATDSTTETDWVAALPTIGEIGQSYALAIALQGIQTDKRQLSIEIPAGWYVKAENSGTGTHAESILGAEQTIYG